MNEVLSTRVLVSASVNLYKRMTDWTTNQHRLHLRTVLTRNKKIGGSVKFTPENNFANKLFFLFQVKAFCTRRAKSTFCLTLPTTPFSS